MNGPTGFRRDAGAKLDDYCRLPGVRRYLLAKVERRAVLHHRRAGDAEGGAIETRIVTGGTLRLDPPDPSPDVERLYG